jgi:hypothetical protein
VDNRLFGGEIRANREILAYFRANSGQFVKEKAFRRNIR